MGFGNIAGLYSFTIEKDCLKIFEGNPAYNIVRMNWNFWTELHFRAGGGNCIINTGYDPLRECDYIRFTIPNATRNHLGASTEQDCRHLLRQLLKDIYKRAGKQDKRFSLIYEKNSPTIANHIEFQ